MAEDQIKLQGAIARTTLKPATFDKEGEIQREEQIEILLKIPMTDTTRTELPDLSRLMDSTVEINLAAVQGSLI